MNFKSLGIAGAVALSTFLLVGIGLTAILESRIEFSVFIGLPAGLLSGVLAGAGLLRWLAGDDVQKHLIGNTIGWFGIGFLGSMVVLVIAWDGGLAATIAGSIVVGMIAAVVGFLSLSGKPPQRKSVDL